MSPISSSTPAGWALRSIPRLVLRRDRRDLGGAEYVRVAAHHLVDDRRGDIGKNEEPGFLGHAGVEDDLEKKITKLVFERRRVATRDRIGDFVGFLDRVRRDRGKILDAIPRTAAVRVAQLRHDREKAFEGSRHQRHNIMGVRGWRSRRAIFVTPRTPRLPPPYLGCRRKVEMSSAVQS